MITRNISLDDLDFPEIIAELQQNDEAVYITQDGQPQAVLMSHTRYEFLYGQAQRPTDIEAIRNDPALIALVEMIQATPPNPAAIRPGVGSLAEALQNTPDDPDFDLEHWTQQWAAVEAEIKARDHADDIAEGRG